MNLTVCIGRSCHLNGAHGVANSFQHLIEEYQLHDKVNFSISYCARRCGQSGVSVTIDDTIYRIAPEEARSFFRENVLAKLK